MYLFVSQYNMCLTWILNWFGENFNEYPTVRIMNDTSYDVPIVYALSFYMINSIEKCIVYAIEILFK